MGMAGCKSARCSPIARPERSDRKEPGLRREVCCIAGVEANDTLHHVFEASVVNIDQARPCNEIIDCQWHAYSALEQLDATDATKRIVRSFLRRL